ncbi:MAG TPA: sigma-70 family RNA polymerase sigma factor [Polyangiaceae bacterium]|jgi:RNA polymerase sigma-32 factor|nr:sigma-70 family RNA polymerase sigma factor [Polyangiaceae bacterium]
MATSKRVRPAGYLSTVNHCPKLSREREHELAVRWYRHGDTKARDLLIRANLHHVVAIAHRHRCHHSATLEELIAEGNFGLVRAIAKFDPERGTRFVTYAAFWIRAYMFQYLARSKSLVTTGVHSKIFSKIKRARDEIRARGAVGDTDEEVAARLTLSPERLRALTERLNVGDVPWDGPIEGGFGGGSGALESREPNPEDSLLDAETGMQRWQAVTQVLMQLDDRERYIVEQRLMAHREEQLSLADIGRHFRVSRERARQLEQRAMHKLKAALLRSSVGADFLASDKAA